MTERQFLDKWHDLEAQGYWCETAARLFWVRSYNMPNYLLLEMSQDFLSIPEYADPDIKGSSIHLARSVIGKAMRGED